MIVCMEEKKFNDKVKQFIHFLEEEISSNIEEDEVIKRNLIYILKNFKRIFGL